MIKFDQVTKKFGSQTALRDISFEIGKGEFVFLTGPSGAGKTTVINILLRDLYPDSGRVLIENHNIAKLNSSELPYYRRKIGVVFQDFKLLHDMTVAENIALALEIIHEDEDKKYSKIKKVLGEVGLISKASLFPRQLSGGEIQRAVLARAKISDPKIILADEPTGNLDPATSKQIVSLLVKEANDNGVTVLVATHDVEIVNFFKKRVLHLDEGQLVADRKSAKYKE